MKLLTPQHCRTLLQMKKVVPAPATLSVLPCAPTSTVTCRAQGIHDDRFVGNTLFLYYLIKNGPKSSKID
jgi:hypothetical protein